LEQFEPRKSILEKRGALLLQILLPAPPFRFLGNAMIMLDHCVENRVEKSLELRSDILDLRALLSGRDRLGLPRRLPRYVRKGQ
jgi:hypothetical protein